MKRLEKKYKIVYHKLKYNPPDSKKLDDQGWETIITKNYNSPDNEEELKSFLMNYGYKQNKSRQPNDSK